MHFVEKVQSNLYLIKDYNLNHYQRTGLYIYLENTDVTLIETCSSPPFRYILAGLSELRIELKHVKNIIITHANLDYGSSLRVLMNYCPKVKLFVHPNTPIYTSDTIELIRNKNAVDKYNSFIPTKKVHIHHVKNGETLEFSKKQKFTFFYTPGSTKHHISIFDAKLNAVFTGDIIGTYFQEDSVELYLPAISLTQFNLEKILKSKNKIQMLSPKHIFLGNYGISSNVTEIYRQFDYWLCRFIDLGKCILKKEKDIDKAINAVSKTIHEEINLYLMSKNVSIRHPMYEKIKFEINVCAAGMIIYLQNNHAYNVNKKI
ncbi:MBL fold metallo-hydrolase [Bacillus cereus]|uniref:MBL fold metallo-hydrolase n=1 Tax=Bacillus cereus TaxID=1396 RepID=UPI001E3BBA3F|nr:MBL fold metallo-hydrolase [Bacillus cereus]MCD2338385.1 MBL fold metallo-hydrolase [Bacillus cereus]